MFFPISHTVSGSGVCQSIETTGLRECYALRHRYFVQERGWVADDPTQPERETDGYDPHAVHFACFDDEGVCAYLRALAPEQGWMLDCEFAALLSLTERGALKRENALELSRLVVRAGTSPTLCPHPVEHLLKALYGFARKGGFDTFYFVVEAAWPLAFRRRFGLPFEILGRPYRFPDGTQTVLAKATLSQMEDAVQKRDPEKFAWYQTPA